MAKKESIIHGLLKGLPVSEGIAIGKVLIMESPWDEVVPYDIEDDKVKKELNRYSKAIDEVILQLAECRDLVYNEIGEDESKIFEAHLSILKDPFFKKEIPELIKKKKKNAEYILKHGLKRLQSSFNKMENDYFRTRVDDVHDVAIRILRILLQLEDDRYHLDKPAVLVANRLTPSDTARIYKEKIIGIVTEMGGKNSHTSILARSMGLPAIVGVDRLMSRARSAETIIVDGNSGIVHIDPTEEILDGYRRRQKQLEIYRRKLSKDIQLPSRTLDNVDISLKANITITADISMAVRYRADGIGLFRTELPFLSAGRLLSEEEQFKIYKTVIESMKDKIVTIRTLDLGGDKFLPFQGIEKERNPFLGWRSIRIFLQEKEIFKVQLRAILRASVYGKVRILFPMISSLEEIFEIRGVFDETKHELKKKKISYDEKIPVGIMIEIPSAAIMADRFADHVDFLSIGTNDLIQYTLAVDRNNEKVAKFYQPVNPAILKLIHNTIVCAKDAGKSVSICGEMAGNPLYTGMLLGFGLRELSMSPVMLPEVKERVRAITIDECEELAEEILKLTSVSEIDSLLIDFHRRVNKKQSVPYFEEYDRSSV